MEKEQADQQFLTCEKKWIFYILICIAGYFGAYTYVLRGNIFCNAQTGNIVLMGIAFGSGDFSEGVYYLIPISAYLMGAFISEILPPKIQADFSILPVITSLLVAHSAPTDIAVCFSIFACAGVRE